MNEAGRAIKLLFTPASQRPKPRGLEGAKVVQSKALSVFYGLAVGIEYGIELDLARIDIVYKMLLYAPQALGEKAPRLLSAGQLYDKIVQGLVPPLLIKNGVPSCV